MKSQVLNLLDQYRAEVETESYEAANNTRAVLRSYLSAAFSIVEKLAEGHCTPLDLINGDAEIMVLSIKVHTQGSLPLGLNSEV